MWQTNVNDFLSLHDILFRKIFLSFIRNSKVMNSFMHDQIMFATLPGVSDWKLYNLICKMFVNYIEKFESKIKNILEKKNCCLLHVNWLKQFLWIFWIYFAIDKEYINLRFVYLIVFFYSKLQSVKYAFYCVRVKYFCMMAFQT